MSHAVCTCAWAVQTRKQASLVLKPPVHTATTVAPLVDDVQALVIYQHCLHTARMLGKTRLLPLATSNPGQSVADATRRLVLPVSSAALPREQRRIMACPVSRRPCVHVLGSA
jgi:hypothetical protein